MTTTSTAQNMPSLDVIDMAAGVSSYRFSPDDRYFAVAGFTGFEVFAWDKANGVLSHIASVQNTKGRCWSGPGSGGCTGNGFGNVAWDSYDNLYTSLGNQVFVYTVSDSGLTPAPGSPHIVPDAHWITVVTAAH